MKKLKTPTTDAKIKELDVGDKLLLSGTIFTGRDAVLPKLVSLIENQTNSLPFSLNGIAIMHTAVSDAGIAPTTSNKEEIESTIPILSKEGVKIHIGKGKLSKSSVESLKIANSIFVVTPPVAALLSSSIKSKKVVAFKEEGMEAIFKLEVENIPGIVAISKGKSIFE
ncbi:fumarate hydratase C-terminal domain-containing protein [Methanobrevibacter filiformis]|uniref:Fumarate hydratase class I, anaerobic n=1 Tax=Methanobrevibacter filiformis TaxID=55758 RepID=A0A166BYX3_9EURY|nr:fumarate hydratase C-terminal domain-containing protein [Methanobrevibacter filiformis]KZX09887.1 fumarate hydratase class I, anaerobic [Methanobrevibacter filiformis]